MAQALGEDLVQPCELQDDSSSLGSDSELSGPGPYRQADRYGFIGGSSAEPGPGHPPADLIRQREMKWVEMTSHWEKTMSRRYKKVKMQCRKGIPSALRARCWPLLCGAHVCQKNSPGTYQAWADAARGWEGMPRGLAPNGVFWHRQQGLLQVLKAYTLYRPEQGYCQAQGPVAAVLLMHLPPEEAFWCLVQICEVYLPGYYGPHMVRGWDAARGYRGRGWAGGWRPGDPGDRGWALGVEVQVGVGPLLYLPEWFLCLFARSLPFPTVLRVWDAFLSVKVLFRVGLTLVRLALGTAEQRLACPGLLETLGALRTIPPAQLQEEAFMSQVHSVALSEHDLQRQIRAQLAQLPESASGPPPRPQARLPGAQAIFEAQQLAGARGGTRPEVPRIVVQPPEEPRPPRRKPQTRGKTFHGLLTRSRGPPIEGPSRSHRGSTSFLDTRF
uniref:TBC1 domain family member 10C n=1 Tax=Equus asinus asinus TaxID=83772 RepID=A0A8C4LHQ1_EQUAS